MNGLEELQKALELFPSWEIVCSLPLPPDFLEGQGRSSRTLYELYYRGQIGQWYQRVSLLISAFQKDYETEVHIPKEVFKFWITVEKAKYDGQVHVSRKQLSDERLKLEKEIADYIQNPTPKKFKYWKDHQLGRLSLITELLEPSEHHFLTVGEAREKLKEVSKEREKKIDVVEEMDKFERNESLAEGKQ